MLTLDTERLDVHSKVSRLEAQQASGREATLQDIQNKQRTVQKDGEFETTSLEQQMGTPLSSAELIRRLQVMNKSLLFEVSNADPSKMGIYQIRKGQKMFICGMERGFMPERSVRHAKGDRVADPDGGPEWQNVLTFAKETRGWRTVLMRLLRARLITQPQIDRMFPPNLNSRNWQTLTT